jgi:hypothetical protein
MTAPDYIANVTSKNPCMRGLTKQQIRIFSLPHKVYPTKRCSGRPPIQDIQLQQHNRIGAKTTFGNASRDLCFCENTLLGTQ